MKASDAADSHCAVGIDWMAPRTISDTFAITGSASPQRRLDPVGYRDRHAEHVHLERQQEHAVEEQHQPRRVAKEMRREPRALPHRRQQRDLREAEEECRRRSLPAIATALIARLNRNPCSSSGVHFRSVVSDRRLPGLHLRFGSAMRNRPRTAPASRPRARGAAAAGTARDALGAARARGARLGQQTGKSVVCASSNACSYDWIGATRNAMDVAPHPGPLPAAGAACPTGRARGHDVHRAHTPNPGTRIARSHRCMT